MTDWEARARELFSIDSWNDARERRELALQLAREMANERAEEIAKAIEPTKIRGYICEPIDSHMRQAAAIARCFITKPGSDPLGMQKTGLEMEAEARIRADEREKIAQALKHDSELLNRGMEGRAEDIARGWRGPKGREQVLEEALCEMPKRLRARATILRAEGDEAGYEALMVAAVDCEESSRSALEYTP